MNFKQINIENISAKGVVAFNIITLPAILEKTPPILEGIAIILKAL